MYKHVKLMKGLAKLVAGTTFGFQHANPALVAHMQACVRTQVPRMSGVEWGKVGKGGVGWSGVRG